jgi:hypothetical protein
VTGDDPPDRAMKPQDTYNYFTSKLADLDLDLKGIPVLQRRALQMPHLSESHHASEMCALNKVYVQSS